MIIWIIYICHYYSFKMSAAAYTSFISDVYKSYRVEKNTFASPDIFTHDD